MGQITPYESMTKEQLIRAKDVYGDLLRKQISTKAEMDLFLSRGGEFNRAATPIVKRLKSIERPRRRTRLQLLKDCQKAGMRLCGGSPASADCAGQNLTLVGEPSEWLYNLDETFRRLETGEAPYGLNFEQMMGIGQGLCSVEETLACVHAYYKKRQRMPAPCGWLRCRNHHSSRLGYSLNVYWDSVYGVGVNSVNRLYRDPHLGGLLRK